MHEQYSDKPKLSQGTPTIIVRQRKQMSQLGAKVNKKKVFKKKDKEKIVNELDTLLPERIVDFIKMQIDLHAKKGKGRRYSKEMIAFALSLYHVSGKAYRLVSKLFLSKSPKVGFLYVKVNRTK